MPSISIEDYIKTIFMLEREHQRASTQRIAQHLDVKMASVTGMVKHLAAEGYVSHVPYKGVRLTRKGSGVALGMLRRHRLIELFLAKALDLPWEELHADAEALEHVVSDKLIERIFEYLGRPQFDPHGHIIPDKDGNLPPLRGVTLDQAEPGTQGKVVEVSDRDPEFLRYLTNLELTIGSKVRVKARAPFGGPIMLDIDGTTVAIGADAARRIRVDAKKPVRRPKRRKNR